MPVDLEAVAHLIEKYSGRVPRYTSYPTAVEFKSGFSATDWRNELAADLQRSGPKTSLYVHIPFCKTLCFFCACAREGGRNRERVAPYLQSLAREMQSYANEAASMQISQLHFGGGSPNYLTPGELRQLISLARTIFPSWDVDAELSIEFDPRETSIDHLQAIHDLGFSRISFGVQDFHPTVQRAIHRDQSRAITELLVHEARARGIKEINFDLIYGLPEQTLDTWRDTLSKVIAIRPDRLAVYGYAHVDWRAKTQRAFNADYRLPSAHERIELFSLAHRMFTEAGYRYLGLDHFALESDTLTKAYDSGTMRRNFMGYSTQAGVRVLGFGASAISSTDMAYAQNAVGVDEYNSAIRELGAAVAKGMILSPEDRARKDVIEGVMCRGRIDLRAFAATLHAPLDEALPLLADQLATLEEDGLIERCSSACVVTMKGRFFLRNIASLFDGYLHQYAPSAKVFSSAC